MGKMTVVENIANLVKDHHDVFRESVAKRMSTSSGNKTRHERVLRALDEKDYEALGVLISCEWYYHKPLDGVICCIKADQRTKELFFNAYRHPGF